MAKELIVVWETDATHTHATKVLFGIFSSKEGCIRDIKKYCKRQADPLDSDDEYNLIHIDQTQNRGNNYMLEKATINTILL